MTEPLLNTRSEDATFNRLKRVPLQQVRLQVRALNHAAVARTGNGATKKVVKKLLHDSGWNVLDYHKALAEAIGNGK